MKHKYYVVEYISYQSENGYPGLGTEARTQERIHFSSKKKAKKFIKRFMKDDPDYVRMWIAHITLHTVTEKIKMVKFPSEWANDALISKKERAENVHKEAPISENKAPFSLGVTEAYWKDTHLGPTMTDDELGNKEKEKHTECSCELNEDGTVALNFDDCSVHPHNHIPGQVCALTDNCSAVRCQNTRYKTEDKKESDTFQA